MKIIEKIATQNPCYKNGKTIKPKGVMIHSVGCSQPDPLVFVKNWQSASAQVCVHAVLGTDGNVYQLLPWNRRAWHCGSGSKGSGNDLYISFEMTEPSTIIYSGGATWTEKNSAATKTHVLATYKYAVEFTAYLCKKYGFNPLADGVIISHSEGYKRGIASNHGDVEHIWNKFNLTMNQFRKDVNAAMSGSDNITIASTSKTSSTTVTAVTANNASKTVYRVRKTWADAATQKGAYENLTKAKECADKNSGYKVFDSSGKVVYTPSEKSTKPTSEFKEYKVKVTTNPLNIRKGPGVNYTIVGKIKDKGVYTIVSESKGVGAKKWGKLKSGKGWISLDHTNKL